jgi:SAM-dependent methyltransferase
MTDPWSERADAYRASPRHRERPDLDLVIAWCEPRPRATALDVATGGGHVATRLKELGCTVVTADSAPGMGPDVVCRAEELSFADESFDVVVNRVAADHFHDVPRAVAEMARVSRSLVVTQDLLCAGGDDEEAERLRDASHVRNYSEAEWRRFLEDGGLEMEQAELLDRLGPFDDWLALTNWVGETAARVRELLRHCIVGADVRTSQIAPTGRKAA